MSRETRVCATPGCPILTTRTHCPEHERAHTRKHNLRANQRYGTPEYKRNRQAALERDGHRCRVCRTTVNVQAHHVVPIEIAEASGWTPQQIHALENLVSLCDRHNKEADARARAQ